MRKPSQLLDDITPALYGLAGSIGKTADEKKDLFQVGYEQALILEPKFDPTRGVKFLTYVWKRVLVEMLRYARRNMPESKKALLPMLVDATADQAERTGGKVDVMNESEQQLKERQLDVQNGEVAAMLMRMGRDVGTDPGDPEGRLIRAESRRRVRKALEAAIATLGAEDQEIVRRHGIRGEELKAVLMGTATWRERDYRRGCEHYGRLLKRIGEYVWVEVGPETGRLAEGDEV